MSTEEESKYLYPVEELDKIIEQMNQGIQPMISDEMMTEVQLRLKEIERSLFDDEYDDSDTEIREKHKEMLKARIEKERRKATRHDVIILDISPEQKQKIREQMSVSIVRPNPNSMYNKTDDELYVNDDRRLINEKLKGLKNCYYNQTDWVNAVKIILEAVDVSLGKYGNSDYPWLTYEEAVKQFNEHKIRLKYPIPKLYVNNSTIMTDKEVLKGILSGDIVLRNKKDDAEEFRKKKKPVSKPVYEPYNTFSTFEHQQMLDAHRAGYETPISGMIRKSSTTYNPAAMPIGNRFAKQRNLDNNGNPILYDWSKEGAGENYFNMTRGRQTNSSDIISFINKENDDMLGTRFSTNMQSFLKSMKQDITYNGGYDYTLPNYMQPPVNGPNVSNTAAEIERELLASIQMNNPTK